MLHIEQYLSGVKLYLDDGKTVGVTPNRRELAKAFGNWVACHCKRNCGVQWNFANDTGLHRGGLPERCPLVKLVDTEKVSWWIGSAVKEVQSDTFAAWLDSRGPRDTARPT